MKLKNSYFYTLREDQRDEDSVSGNLLVKAGYIKKTSAGVYIMLPLGLKVCNNIENIIRNNMNKQGGQELMMPALISSEYYEKSGRLSGFGKSIYKLQDRNGHDFVLGPTHEELFALAASSKIKSYKDMPFNIYQFQTKFRDEPRARFGLIRVKEFIMKDAYSFDKDEKGLDESYKKMYDAYKDSFDEMGINYKLVKASTGVMGGLLSEEFQAITPIGEDDVIYCQSCDFSSNKEVAEVISPLKDEEKELKLEEKETPNYKTIEEVCNFLKVDPKKSLKAVLVNDEGELVIFFINGDRELNESKALKLLKSKELVFADDALLEKNNIKAGYVGPIGLTCKYYVDKEVLNMKNFVTGANKVGYHFINTNIKDFNTKDNVYDLVNAKEKDICPICGKPLKVTKGIEIGNLFKLGTKYSKAMNLQYADEQNKLQDVWMGSYGIGIGRTMAAIVEQNYDEKGIIWPENIAPYKAIILLMQSKDEIQTNLANKIYEELNSKGIECILDDRDERPGVKFNDAELLGIPHIITVGRDAKDNIVEYKNRKTDNKDNIKLENILNIFKN